MTDHLNAEDAARWVAGVMDDAAADLAEAHAAKCAACAALLQAEARAEERLAAAVRSAPAPRRSRAPVVLAMAMAAALALLASAALWGRAGHDVTDAGVAAQEDLAFADEAYASPSGVTSYAPVGLEAPRYEADLALEPNPDFVPFAP